MRFETLAIHSGREPDPTTGALATPIYQTSTFVFQDVGVTRGYDYTRTANPTRKALEECIAALEGGKAGFAFSSGMAAETTIMHLLKAGDHVISGDDVYGGTYRLFQKVMRDFGLEFTFLRMDDRSRIEGAIRPNTRMIWIETPSNPLLNIVDLETVVDIARRHNLMMVADNTFATPYFLKPIEYGVDLVVHSTTKYLNGHCDVIGGAVVTTTDELTERVQFLLNAMGSGASPSARVTELEDRMAKAGDKIIITKGPAIEATGIFATMFPKLMEREFGAGFSQKAQEIFYKMSVVEDAMTAVSVGVRDDGVTAMHDATECGIWGGLYEIAQAADLGVRVEKERIVVEDCVREICQYFGIDPYASISEGTLIITCKEHKAQEVVEALSGKGIVSSVVGGLINPGHGMILVEGGKVRQLKHPKVDPFWRVFYDALEKYASIEKEEAAEMAKDPVCGMEVDEKKAAATSEHKGKTYYFCAPGCKKAFDENPEKYLKHQHG